MKTFTPKCPELPRLNTYEGDFPGNYWKDFPSYKPTSWKPSSWISGDELLSCAEEAGVDNLGDTYRARDILNSGANTG